MGDHDTYGTTQTFQSHSVNDVKCPCCLSVVDAASLKFKNWDFSHIGNGKVKCHVCSSIIPIEEIPPNWREK